MAMEATTTRTTSALATLLFVLFTIGVVVVQQQQQEQTNQQGEEQSHHNQYLHHRRKLVSTAFENEGESSVIIDELQQRFQPHELYVNKTDLTSSTSRGKTVEKFGLARKQFIHQHHMKTGGTSMDRVIRCAVERLERYQKDDIPNVNAHYFSIHECSRSRYQKCIVDKESACRQSMKESSIISYCAPLKDLKKFGWNPNPTFGVDENEQDNEAVLEHVEGEVVDSENNDIPNYPTQALTVLRHPVDRVWSMFRFSTKGCYKCTELKEIYKQLDAGTLDPEFDDLCLAQLQNHLTTNLLSSNWDESKNSDNDEDRVQQAIYNLKHFYTLVGLTEHLNTTLKMAGIIFPWMNETVPHSDVKCPLPHANASPQNNHCGVGDTHWELPSHPPDEETIELIQQHNQLDLILYDAAVEHFHNQVKALGIEILEKDDESAKRGEDEEMLDDKDEEGGDD